MGHRILSAIAKVFAKTDTDLYAPLDTSSHTIRLLQLQPGAWNDDIRAVLHERRIAEAKDHYTTISVRDPDVRTACETYTDFVHQHLVHLGPCRCCSAGFDNV
jgi:hypothetical protein